VGVNVVVSDRVGLDAHVSMSVFGACVQYRRRVFVLLCCPCWHPGMFAEGLNEANQADFEGCCVISCFGVLAVCRKQSDGDDSDEEEVVKRPKAVRGFFTVHPFRVFAP